MCSGVIFTLIKRKVELDGNSLKVWRKAMPMEKNPLCPMEIAYLVAYEEFVNRDNSIAIWIILAIDCYLRNGELADLTVGDVSILKDSKRYISEVVLCLRKTKTERDKSALVIPAF